MGSFGLFAAVPCSSAPVDATLGSSLADSVVCAPGALPTDPHLTATCPVEEPTNRHFDAGQPHGTGMPRVVGAPWAGIELSIVQLLSPRTPSDGSTANLEPLALADALTVPAAAPIKPTGAEVHATEVHATEVHAAEVHAAEVHAAVEKKAERGQQPEAEAQEQVTRARSRLTSMSMSMCHVHVHVPCAMCPC